MKWGTLCEVVDFRAIKEFPPIAVLDSVPGGLLASYSTGRDELFSLGEDDDLEIEGDRVTVHTEGGMVVFAPLESGSDVLEVMGIDDLGLIHSFCMSPQ